MGSCLQRQIAESQDEKAFVHVQHNSQSSQSQLYQLNDLRSLEGVARIWSNKIQYNQQHGLLKLQNATSVRVQGNHSSNPFAPISISTYYFIHAPNVENQPNLLHSHSAPPKLTRVALGSLFNKDTNNNNNNNNNDTNENENTIKEDEVLEMQLPEPETIAPQSRKVSILSPIASPSLVNLHAPDSPQYVHSFPPQMMPMVPVFSFSNSMPSENIGIGPLELDAYDNNGNNNGFHLNIGLDDIESKHNHASDSNSQWVPVKHTYSNRNVFTLADSNLTTDDFMEYETSSAFAIGVGAGASGIVKKAFHFSSCKMVAIKQCRSKQEHEVIAFEKEAQLYKEFMHNPYIIDIIGFGRGDMNNELLMALQYMDCGSVESLKINEIICDIKQRQLIVGYIAFNVLKALDELHNGLYIHNDIKPANILANKYGEVKLSDFGTMQRLAHMGEYLTKNNGTQRYQPPEKMIFEIKYNQKVDIWSLGITCYELLFGIEEHENDIQYTTNPPRLDPNECGMSVNCCDFINKCLIIDMNDRPSANELLKHPFMIDNINYNNIKYKWPWSLKEDELIGNGRNEDLLFMISALIIYYSTKEFDNADNGSIDWILHRRVSAKPKNANQDDNNKNFYTDEERISNIAKYALCSKDTVMDRIKVTVSYIKSQVK